MIFHDERSISPKVSSRHPFCLDRFSPPFPPDYEEYLNDAALSISRASELREIEARFLWEEVIACA